MGDWTRLRIHIFIFFLILPLIQLAYPCTSYSNYKSLKKSLKYNSSLCHGWVHRVIVFYVKPLNDFLWYVYWIIAQCMNSFSSVHTIISCQKIARALMFTSLLKSTINKSLFLFFRWVVYTHFDTPFEM